jgi:hypothetical protein
MWGLGMLQDGGQRWRRHNAAGNFSRQTLDDLGIRFYNPPQVQYSTCQQQQSQGGQGYSFGLPENPQAV